MSANIKKGISYVAFGFLFILVNFNLNFNDVSVNITPDFVGWILIFLACDKLSCYTEGRRYLKWSALVIAAVSAALWLLSFAKPQLDTGIAQTVLSIAEAVYMFILFGILVKIAVDFGSRRASTINFLRYFNIIVFIGLNVIALFLARNQNTALAMIFTVIGATALVMAVVTLFVLFGLRKDIKETGELE